MGPSHTALGTDHDELGVSLPRDLGDRGDDLVGGPCESPSAAFGCGDYDGFGAPWSGRGTGSCLGHGQHG